MRATVRIVNENSQFLPAHNSTANAVETIGRHQRFGTQKGGHCEQKSARQSGSTDERDLCDK